ncbi:MAG: signal peptidase II [Chloroflexota bacterium]
MGAVFFPFFLVVAADQLTKFWVRAHPLGETIYQFGFLRITRIQNTGAAFGLFPNYSFILTVVDFIAIALILVILLWSRFSFLNKRLSKLALGLILGGTIGNLLDRLRFGSVTDFIDVGFWPVFNIADSALTVGIIILAYSLFRLMQTEKH